MTRRANAARASVRRRIDMPRVARALSQPGIDPRSWIRLARVDDDPDAAVWDEVLGWLVDVTLMDGEGPITCRVITDCQDNGEGEHRPPHYEGVVLVAFPDGDPNTDAIVIGELHDTANFTAPTSVNGDTIVESAASSGQVSAIDTHISAFPSKDTDQEWRNARLTVSDDGLLILAAPQADQSYVRGENYADALGDFLDAMDAFAAAIAVAPVNIGAAVVALDPATLSAFQSAITALQSARDQYLSEKIKGD